MKDYTSWGRYPQIEQQAIALQWRSEVLPQTDKTVLPFGQGRSYGDCCLNEDGFVLDTAGLNRFIAFDKQRGVLRCESGVTLHEILQLIIPHGWFLPVTPGTRYVSIGGAVANDVHGKNHHRAGTFGCHINALELLRSDGQRYLCTADENPDLFSATIAGLGLTGLITWVEIRLKAIRSSTIQGESIRFSTLDEFFDLSSSSDQDWEYTVSWIDCAAKGRSLGRGIFYRGNHADSAGLRTNKLNSGNLHLGFDAPQKLLNKYTVSMFNTLLYHKHLPMRKTFNKDMIPFFYPLDKIGHWNRLYGKNGFLQFQCVLPMHDASNRLKDILDIISRAGSGSFLAVLKVFGDKASPGLMSFPRQGVTLALDFPLRGKATLTLMDDLEKQVSDAGGAIYPAKDACMKPSSFMQYFPNYSEFEQLTDPLFKSNLWRRVHGH